MMAKDHLIGGNHLTLLQNGTEYFPCLISEIDSAQRTIYLETYIFAADEVGSRVADALQRASHRGVAVCVLMDGFGSAHFPSDWLNRLRESGVAVQWFRPEVYRFRMRRYRLRRLHRKLVAVDGAVAFVGGINVNADARAEDGHTVPRLDFAVRLEGHLAQEIQAVMMRLWNSVTWASSSFRSEQLVALIRHRTPAVTLPDLQLLLRDNVRHRREIERAYLRAMSTAQHEVLIANAYFLPGLAFRRALIQAARRGVRVALLLQGKVEYRLQHYATRALYDDLLAAGVEIYEYQASYLHAKVAVIDERWSTVGSSNIDPFSLLLAREANLLIFDAGFSLELKADLMAAIAHNALRIEPARWRRLGWFARLRSHVSYAVIRMLVGVLGHPRSRL